jgi:hypothetical protein
LIINASAQKCGGVQKKMMANRYQADRSRVPVAYDDVVHGRALQPRGVKAEVENCAEDREAGSKDVCAKGQHQERAQVHQKAERERVARADPSRGHRAGLRASHATVEVFLEPHVQR